MGDEGGLHRMQLVAIGEALDGQDVGAVKADRQRQAGIDAPAVDQHGAGAALAAVAALLGAGEVEPLAQQVEQGDARIDLQLVAVSVDGEGDGKAGHGRLAPVCLTRMGDDLVSGKEGKGGV